MHLKPFYYDSDEVIPLNIAIKDTHEQIVDKIIEHSIDEVTKVLNWKVKWEDESEAQEIWELNLPSMTLKRFTCISENLTTNYQCILQSYFLTI